MTPQTSAADAQTSSILESKLLELEAKVAGYEKQLKKKLGPVIANNAYISNFGTRITKLESLSIGEASVPQPQPNYESRIKALEKKLQSPANSKAQMVCLSNGTLGGSGYYWSWGKTNICDGIFTKTTKSYSNDSVVISKAGRYQILIRTACQTSTNSYLSLYINGAEVARSYSSSCSNYYSSFHINEIRDITANAYLQVYQTYNSAPLQNDPHNSFQVISIQ